jgi:hypothetical protein
MVVNYIFTDWSAADAKQRPEYPQARVLTQRIPLLNINHTNAYIEAKLNQLDTYKDAPEESIPYCTDEDLWRKETVWKYYKNKDKTDGRSTKNFDSSADAYVRLADDGYTGIVIEVKGQVVACRYCNAFSVCTQKDDYLSSGDLVLN